MKARLMYPDRDADLTRPMPPHARDLTQDLAVDTLLSAMAGDDAFLAEVARWALVSGLDNDVETVRYRQEIMTDCLANAATVRALYGLAVEAIDRQQRGSRFGFFARYPSGILYNSVEMLEIFVAVLRKVRDVADLHADRFASRGFTTLFATLRRELDDAYFASVQDHLTTLKFKHGVLLSAKLGAHNEGTHYVLRQPRDRGTTWLQRLRRQGPPAYTFHIHERDEAGARTLSELKDRGINLVANAAAQSAEHILSFFAMLRTELAFYVCGLNLRDRLAGLGAPITLPRPEAVGSRRLRFSGLYDVCLALTREQRVVGNTIDADGANLVIVTGANQGGKSSFLRSIGLAQLMMHCGLFVGAESFSSELCTGLFTHYAREEDATMHGGKLDEELRRVSDIVDAIAPNAMVLCNESFAATNEREGSAIASQVVRALVDKGIKIFFVTHLYEFAHDLFGQQRRDALFLRAQRRPDGTRTFRVVPGEPLETSYGEDLYREVFAVTAGAIA